MTSILILFLFLFLVVLCALLRFFQLRAISTDRNFYKLLAEMRRRQIRQKYRSRQAKELKRQTSASSTDSNLGLLNTPPKLSTPDLYPLPPLPLVPGAMHINLDDNYKDIRPAFNPGMLKDRFVAFNFFALLVAFTAGMAAVGVASVRVSESFFYHHLFGFGMLVMPPIYIGFTVYFSYWLYPQVCIVVIDI